ncbi:hypothetical protein LEN26_014250 [Aphanomyces euteiches]|nr:hypothetical protein LEN26_014250 [Aphanomyces euteiches]
MSPVPTPLKKIVFKEVVDVNENVVSNQQGMSDVLVDYYKDLFAAPEVLRPGDEVSSFLTPLTRRKQLPEQAQQELSAPLRANEFYHAIRHSSTPAPFSPSLDSHATCQYARVAAQERSQVTSQELSAH